MAEVTIEGERVVVPAICPVCRIPATKPYEYKKEYINQWVTFSVAYCDQHSDQLVQSDKKLRWIRIAILGVVILLWGLAAYALIARFPELKFVPGETIIAWGISLILVMCATGIMLAVAGGAIVIRFALHALPGFVRRFFESGKAKVARSAITVRDFKLRTTSLMGGPAQLQWAIFSIADPKYALELHELNPGSKLMT